MFPSFSRAVSAATFILLCSGFVCAQSGPPLHPPNPKVLGPARWEPRPQEVSAAYWTLEPGWSTTLEMRNNVIHHELTVTPVIRASTGQETLLAPITIAPQHVISLDLRTVVTAANQTPSQLGSFGSVAFRFDGLYPDNLFGATIVRREGEPIDFHFDGQAAGSTYTSGGIEGMWWLPAPSSADYLILSNPLKKTVAGTLALSSSSASHRPIAVSLGPGETKRINLGEVLGPSSIGAVGGLTLSLPGKELISATQIVFDEVTGLAAIMKLFDRDPDDQPRGRVLRAPMMALSQPDQGLGFPSGTQLLPRILLRNAASASTLVSATVEWRNQNSGTFALPDLTLSPGEIRTVNLANYQQAGQIPEDANWATLKLAYTGRAADLVAVAISYDKDHRYGLQTPFSENLSRLWAGGMWHIDPTHNTFITTGNGGTEPTTAEVTLFYNGGTSKYRMQKMLSPSQQLWLDLGHLVHDQVPDSDGHTLPPDIMVGSYELRDLDHATLGQMYEGKLVIDKTYGHAAYGCGSCCGYDGVAFDPGSFGGPPDIDNQDFIHANDTCSGTVDDVTGSGYDWSSSDTAVATLPNSMLHTVAVGNATGSNFTKLQWAHPPSCPAQIFNPKQPVTVASPNQVEPISTASQGVAACSPSTWSGWVRNVTNQVQYADGSAYAFSGLSAADTITTGSRHDLGSGTSTGSATTTGDGSFPDTYSVCSSACPGSTGETDALQSWTLNGIPLPHSDSVIYKCNSISIDGN